VDKPIPHKRMSACVNGEGSDEAMRSKTARRSYPLQRVPYKRSADRAQGIARTRKRVTADVFMVVAFFVFIGVVRCRTTWRDYFHLPQGMSMVLH